LIQRQVSFGYGLAVFGGTVAALSFAILISVPFTALGIACVILGLTLLWLPEQAVPAGAVRSVLEGATLTIEALLEEFDATEKAVYLPPKAGLVTAFIPLKTNPETPSVQAMLDAPRRVLTEAGGKPGLLVIPPGAELVRATYPSEEPGLEGAVQYLLTEASELCSSAKLVESADQIILELKGIKVKTEAARYNLCLGSIPASLAACVVTAIKKRPLYLASQN
jgi:hypothetical protein